MKDRSSVVIIPARMDSTRFPGKPMVEIHGIPMIGHVFFRSTLIESAESVHVATCDNVIFDYINSIGGSAIMTSNSHERATDRTAEALENLKSRENKNYDIVAMIQGDEPMVNPYDINKGIEALSNNKSQNIVNLMNKASSIEEFLDVNNVKVVVDTQKRALYFSREPIPSNWKGKREENVFIQTGLIIFRVDYLNNYLRMTPTPLEIIESCDMLRVLEHGDPVHMFEVDSRTIGVDTLEDLKAVEIELQSDKFVSQYSATG